MFNVQEHLEINFRLHDGTDIGPKNYPFATSVATLKENIIAQWPKDVQGQENSPRTINDIKLIHAGKILDNNKTLVECNSPICDLHGAPTTMHVVLRPPISDRWAEGKSPKNWKQPRCSCNIL